MIGGPLLDCAGEAFGAWIFLDPAPTVCELPCESVADALSEPLASRLASIARNRRGRIDRALHRLKSAIHRYQWTTIVGAMLVFLCVALFPIHFRVACDCTLQPSVRRFVAAPFDGQLQESLVQPGDIVEQGQVLARMNARELEWELAGSKCGAEPSKQTTQCFVGPARVCGVADRGTRTRASGVSA